MLKLGVVPLKVIESLLIDGLLFFEGFEEIFILLKAVIDSSPTVKVKMNIKPF